jgi:hypothetical protein
MERIGTMVRVGTTRCSVESWRRKSVTDEFGRFSLLERRSGGIKTAAQAASTAKSTILLIVYAVPLSDICSRIFLSATPANGSVTEGVASLRIYYIRDTG